MVWLFAICYVLDEHTLSFVIKCTYQVVQKNISDISNLQAISRLLVVLKSLFAFKRLDPDVIRVYNDASMILSEKLALINTPSSSTIEGSVNESTSTIPPSSLSTPPVAPVAPVASPPVPAKPSMPPEPSKPPVLSSPVSVKSHKPSQFHSVVSSFSSLLTYLKTSPRIRVSLFLLFNI